MTDSTRQISNGVNKRTLLFVGVVGIVVVLGLIFSDRLDRNDENESPVPAVQNRNSSPFDAVVSNEGGVEVAVTPVNVPDTSRWAFEVVMDTHSAELSEDMVKNSRLVLTSGEILSPSSWVGDPPGGHHRRGVLSFGPFEFSSSGPTLKILEVGGVPEREFKWNLK